MNIKKYKLLIPFLCGLLSTFFILRSMLFSPGLVYVRDSYPSIIGYFPTLVNNGQINLLFIMDTSDLPIYIFSLYPEIWDKLSYAYPIFLGFVSMYFASYYILRTRYKEIISLIVAFLYIISPTFMYFTYWTDYSTFVALYPLFLVGLDYVNKKNFSLLRSSILLSLLLTLVTTDPRGFIFSFLTLFLYVMYRVIKRDFYFLKIVLFSFPFYIMENVRTFYSLLVQHNVYVSTGSSISVVQLWLNYYTFSLSDNLRGIGLFAPLINFYSGNTLFSYVFSFFLPVFVVLSFFYLFFKIIRTDAVFYFFLYSFLVISISSYIVVFNHVFNLNLIYYLNNWLKDSPLFPYMWVIIPSYLSEMIIAPLFLTFVYEINFLLTEKGEIQRLISLIILILVISAQLVFSSPSFASGNYEYNYVPLPVPQNLVQAAEYLHGAKVAVYGTTIYYHGKYYDPEVFAGVPNSVFIPFFNTTHLGNILEYYGVEYVIANENLSYFLSQKDLELVKNFSGIYVFKNLDYKSTFSSRGIYLVYNVNDLNEDVAAVPYYLYVPPEYLAGIIGGSEIYIKADVFRNYSVKIPAQRLPYPTNFSCTIYVNAHTLQILSAFPGISLIQVGNPASENIFVSPGKYAVVLTYISYSEGGVIEICNGSVSLSVDTANTTLSVVSSYLGIISSNGEIEIIHPDNKITYIVNLELIPYSLWVNDTINLHPKNVTVVTYPVVGDVISSVGYNIILGKAEKPPGYHLVPVIILNVLFYALILFLLVRRKSSS
ncbi:hypothetical protein [Sulfolobus sp. S-194]|uniref:hypothetical protein n=1 Tax=Sulfolobus sp. S-194 TaxID=2512240 RepID=UPI0019CF9609|nr:hypothetical protein [Sulfolobus sp. S-194]